MLMKERIGDKQPSVASQAICGTAVDIWMKSLVAVRMKDGMR